METDGKLKLQRISDLKAYTVDYSDYESVISAKILLEFSRILTNVMNKFICPCLEGFSSLFYCFEIVYSCWECKGGKNSPAICVLVN